MEFLWSVQLGQYSNFSSRISKTLTLATLGGALYLFNVWEGIEEITLSTFLYSSWERGHVSVIFQPDLAVDIY